MRWDAPLCKRLVQTISRWLAIILWGAGTSEKQALNQDGCAMTQQLHLNLFIHSRGHHEASWRHPASSPLALTDIRYYQELAQRAEAGLFDSIFLADQLALGVMWTGRRVPGLSPSPCSRRLRWRPAGSE